MARALGVSLPTVRSHVQSVLNKLGAHSRLEVAAMASHYRLVTNGGAGLHLVHGEDRPARRFGAYQG
jgi:two-component system nitrate/nitrite response regulator NarL